MEQILVAVSTAGTREKLKGRFKQLIGSGRKEGLFSDKDVKFLNKELRSMRAALSILGGQPPEWRDDSIVRAETMLWVREMRDLSYDAEDLLDNYRLASLDQSRHISQGKGLVEKVASIPIFKKDKASQQIADDIRVLKESVEEMTQKRLRYKIADPHAPRAPVKVVNPSLSAFYVDKNWLIGIAEARDELIRRLTEGDGVPYRQTRQLKIVSLVGLPGVGKTTLALQVYKIIRTEFDCAVFVPVSADPDMKKVLCDMLSQLDKKYSDYDIISSWDQTKLIDEIREILHNRRYLIVLDDIWDTKSWMTIKRTIVKNGLGSRIITTTRKFDVADEIGGAYKVKPLSLESSKELFCKRIYGKEKCASSTEDEIIDKLIEKYGGLPLAIITISSLLAWTPREQWEELCNAIDSSEQSIPTDSPLYDHLLQILSLSYYNLPSHLRACLLYLSVFPEGYVIRRDRLVWMWIAEGFIQGKQGCYLFELGQSYIDELLNSSMIQEVDIDDSDDDAMVKYCRVPHIVLWFICHLSSEENFLAIIDGGRPGQPRVRVRRISLRNVGRENLGDMATDTSLSRVRSLTAFGPGGNNLMPLLLSCKHLRVLDLEGCDLQSCNLKNIGMLPLLRYLGLRGTHIALVPKEIGNLMFLQVLDLKGTRIKELPSIVAQLSQLLCIYVEYRAKLPQGMGQLTSLEEVSEISVTESPLFANEVASLVRLRVLGVVLQQDEDQGSQRRFLESLCNLEKLQTLRIFGCGDSDLDFLREEWVPPPALRSFITVGAWFKALPAWIPSVNLSELQIGVREMWREGLQALGNLQELRTLHLTVQRMMETLAVDAGAFPRLRVLRLRSQTCLVFRQGAMPAIRTLKFVLDVDNKADGQFDWGLHNLTLLEQVTITLRRGDASAAQVLEAEDALKEANAVHPNRPTLQITTVPAQQDEEQQPEDGTEENSSAGPSEIVECSP